MIQTTATPAVGLPASTLATPYALINPRVFISDYTVSGNAIVIGDEVLNFEGDPTIRGTGTASTQVTSNGMQIASAGDTTYAAVNIRVTGPSSDEIINRLLLNSDVTKRGADRCVNFNVMNFDGSVHRCYAVVLHCNPSGTDEQGTPGYDVSLQPFSVDRYILVAA
jgi:hypothetical protein